VHEGVEEEIEQFYGGAYQKPVLGSQEFIERIKERLGKKARVEAEKPESKRIFSPSVEQIMAATAREYGQGVEELGQRKGAGQNEARMVAIFLGRQLGGYKHEEIGKAVGLGNTSSVSSAYLAMKRRVAREKRLARTVRRIEEALTKSKKRT
jgi:chromosomal replication initiation ATPase DnaA